MSDGEHSSSETVPEIFIGAWREAVGEDGVERVVLVALVALMTIPFLPFWVLLAAIEAAGLYSFDTATERSAETEGK